MRQFTRIYKGFSLVEIITVLAVLAVLSTIGVVMFSRIMEYRRQAEIRQSLNLNYLRIINRMKQDFDQIASATFTKGQLNVTRRTEYEKRYQSVPLEDDRISFPIIYTNADDKISIVQVFYYVDRNLGGVPSLVRVLGPLGQKEPSGAKEIVLSGVLSLRIQCYDGNNWLDQWDKPYYPKAVRMSFVLADENRMWEQIVRETTFWLGNSL